MRRALALAAFGLAVGVVAWAVVLSLSEPPPPSGRYCLASTDGFNPKAIKGLPICGVGR